MKKITSILIGLGISLTLSLGAYANENVIKVVPGIGTQYNFTSEKRKHALHNFAKTSEKEDAFINIEDALYDIGYDEKEKGTSIDVEEIIEILKEKYPQSKEVSFIHIHSLKNKFENTSQDVFPPSPKDIITINRIKKKLREEKINTTLISKIYDGYGIWEYDITQGLAIQLNFQVETDQGSFFSPGAMLIGMQMNSIREKILEDMSLSRKEKINKYVEESKEIGIILKYTPISS